MLPKCPVISGRGELIWWWPVGKKGEDWGKEEEDQGQRELSGRARGAVLSGNGTTYNLCLLPSLFTQSKSIPHAAMLKCVESM